MVSDQIVGTASLAPLAPLTLMRSHRAPPLWLTNKPVSPPARTVCASLGWATSACMRLLSGNGARCRIHDFPASGLCHTPKPDVPRHILYSAVIRCPLRLGPCVTPQTGNTVLCLTLPQQMDLVLGPIPHTSLVASMLCAPSIATSDEKGITTPTISLAPLGGRGPG